MFDFNSDNIDGRIPFDAAYPGYEGPDGWYKHTDTNTILYIRGTWFDNNKSAPMKGLGDIWNNFDIGFSQFHEGYYKYAESVYYWMLHNIKHCKPLIIIGHSAGGAQAQLLGYFLLVFGYKVEKVITYATSPLVFAKQLITDTSSSVNLYYGETIVQNYVLSNDWTQWLKPFCKLFNKYPFGGIIKIKRKYKNFWEWLKSPLTDHEPYTIMNYIERPY